jgi:hypothetical protein
MDFIGHVPTKDLIGQGGRYSFGKTKLYECLDTLGIQRVSRDGDRQVYITEKDLEILDRYIDISNTQGKAEAKAFALSLKASSEPSEGLAVRDSGVPESGLVQLMQVLSQLPVMPAEPDALAPQRQLKEAAEEDWLLSTAQVRQILGMKSWNGGDRFGFKFDYAGQMGSSKAWRVSRGT